MIELIIYEYLKQYLTVPVFLEILDDMPTEYVVFEKTGSSEKNHVHSATIAFQSYAGSMFQSAALNEEVKSVVENMIESDAISSARLNSDYNFTDTQTKKYRYQAVFDITY